MASLPPSIFRTAASPLRKFWRPGASMTSGGGSRFHENTEWSFSTTVETLPCTTTCSKEIGTRNEVERYICWSYHSLKS